jgi:hypothetical protein
LGQGRPWPQDEIFNAPEIFPKLNFVLLLSCDCALVYVIKPFGTRLVVFLVQPSSKTTHVLDPMKHGPLERSKRRSSHFIWWSELEFLGCEEIWAGCLFVVVSCMDMRLPCEDPTPGTEIQENLPALLSPTGLFPE